MGGIFVETEALQAVADEISKYISSVNENIRRLNDAAKECHENMGNDKYSERAVANVGEISRSIERNLDEMNGIIVRILKKKEEIESSIKNF